MAVTLTPDFFNQMAGQHLPRHLGIVVTEMGEGTLTAELVAQRFLLAPNGFMHGGSVAALGHLRGYGCMANLPHGATGFRTIELKCNYLATARRHDRVHRDGRAPR